MRRVVAGFAIAFVMIILVAPAAAAPLRPGEFASREAVLAWMNDYREHRDPAHLPDAVQAMSQLGIFKDPENAGAFIGFIAGALHDNAAQAERRAFTSRSVSSNRGSLFRPGRSTRTPRVLTCSRAKKMKSMDWLQARARA